MMNTKYEPVVDGPHPLFSFQGAYLQIGADISIGPFSEEMAPPEKMSFGHAVAYQQVKEVPVTSVRTAAIKHNMVDKPENVMQMGFEQNGTEWTMAFSVLSDPQGGLIGCDFALTVESNYPQIPMTIERQRIQQKGLGLVVKGKLPADYRAQLSLKFWSNGNKLLPLDAWLAVQVAYVNLPLSEQARIKPGDPIPLVTKGEVLFYPAPGSGDRPVLGNNYPRDDRHNEPRMVRA